MTIHTDWDEVNALAQAAAFAAEKQGWMLAGAQTFPDDATGFIQSAAKWRTIRETKLAAIRRISEAHVAYEQERARNDA